MGLMENNKYKYCLYRIKDGFVKITLSNNWKDLKVEKHLVVLYDVTISFITEFDRIIITGLEDEVHYEQYRTELCLLKHNPREEDVKYQKSLKLFGFTLCDDYVYVKGWYRTNPIHKVKYDFSNYIVQIYE